jgi:glycosyltransferase involved in cell wall biosynthesis
VAQLSIIIPTHNRADQLVRAIQSAKGAGADVKVIVVDDASTDGTAEVCRSMKDIQYLRSERNVRQAAARNLALRECNSPYVAFLDDDDLLLPGALDRLVEVLEADPSVGFVYGQVLVADSINCEPTGEVVPKEVPSGDIFWKLLGGNYIYIHSVLARTALVREVGGFDAAVTGVEDWLLWLRIAERFQVASVPEPVGVWRRFTDTSGQTSSNLHAMCIASARAQAKGLRLRRALDAPAQQRRDVRTRYLDGLSTVLVNRSISDLLARRYRSALATYITAFRFDPRAAVHPYWVKHFLTEQRLRRGGRRQPVEKTL